MTIALRFLPLLAAVAACSSSTTATVQLDAQPGWNGSASVLVHTPAGKLVSRTPITSSLAVDVSDGDTVTVVLQTDGQTTLLSSLDVQRGDLIELPVANPGTQLVTVNVPRVTGAATWGVAVPDDAILGPGDGTLLSVAVPTGAASTPLIATASNETSTLAMYAETSAPISGALPSVTLHDSVSFRPVTVTAINPPADAGSNVEVFGDVYLDDQVLGLFALGSDVPMPTSFGDRVDATARAFHPRNSGSSVSDHGSLVGTVFATAPSGPISLDLSLPDLPQVSALAVTASGASWTLTGGGHYDEIEVILTPSTTLYTGWIFVAPPGTTSITLPSLPADLAPPTFDEVSVTTTEASSVDGYAAALHQPATYPAGTTFEQRGVTLLLTSSPHTRTGLDVALRSPIVSPIARAAAMHRR
jgi:hypothetical protein